MIDLNIPIDENKVRELKTGDLVTVSGLMITARDAAHSYIHKTMIKRKPRGKDRDLFMRLKGICKGSFIYHCGPIMKQNGDEWECVAAGPTTSIREEPYEADVIEALGVAGIIGKGGMGTRTSRALQEHGAVYLNAVGGAAAVAASTVKKVHDVFRLDLGMPEAIWVLELKKFPAVVTMDSSGHSIHDDVLQRSEKQLKSLIG